MGRTSKPKYVWELHARGTVMTPAAWRVKTQYGAKGHGAPTAANLEKAVKAYNASLAPGECNAHLGERYRATYACVRLNDPYSAPIAEWKAAPFQAF